MSGYIEAPVVTDPDDLAQIYFDFITSQFPSYVPQAGQFGTVAGEGWARIAAVAANVFAAMPRAAFRFFGQLFEIEPLDATSASVTSTWTVLDDSGYLIEAGTKVAVLDGSGNPQFFRVAVDVSILSGDTTTADGAVSLVALTPGAASTGLGGPGVVAQLVDVVTYVDTVTLTAATDGGQDAEDDTTFLNRLSTELKLQSPRPILPDDVSALLQNIAGIDRALVLDNYRPAVNEKQTVSVAATGGTFKLTFNTHQTGALAYNASAATIQTALQGLSGVGAGQVAVTGGPVNSALVTVEFTGSLAGTNVGLMTADSTSLTGGSHTATVALLVDGAAALTTEPRTVTFSAIDATGAAVGSGLSASALAYITPLRETGFQFFSVVPTYTGIDVTFEVTATDGFDRDAVVTAAEAAVAAFLDSSVWGLPSGGDRRGWIDTPIVRVNDVAAAIKQTVGVQHVESVLICAHGGSPADSNVTMPGPAALPTAGTILGSHT